MIDLAHRPALICPAIEVPGRLVPWSVPTIGHVTDRRGRRKRAAAKDSALAAFQAEVRLRASLAMAGRAPHAGPVELILHLSRKAPAGTPPGRWWAGTPDRTNLLKGIEDALNGVCYLDDRQVVKGDCIKKYADHDGCRIVVLALPGGGAGPDGGDHADPDS